MKYVVISTHKHNTMITPFLCKFSKKDKVEFLQLAHSVGEQDIFYNLFDAKRLIKIAKERDKEYSFLKIYQYKYKIVPQDEFMKGHNYDD